MLCYSSYSLPCCVIATHISQFDHSPQILAACKLDSPAETTLILQSDSPTPMLLAELSGLASPQSPVVGLGERSSQNIYLLHRPLEIAMRLLQARHSATLDNAAKVIHPPDQSDDTSHRPIEPQFPLHRTPVLEHRPKLSNPAYPGRAR